MVFNQDKKKEAIFRQESLERLSSPERLDQLMQVIAPKDWLALTVFGSLAILGLGWSIVGRIPITVEGKGIFLQPRQVVELQSSIAGQLKSLNVSNGQCVKKDQVLATIDPVSLREQLRLETTNQRHREIQEVNREITRLEQQVTENSKIISSQDGCILELTASLGQVVQPGTRLGNMRVGNGERLGLAMAYFPIKDGKQIKSEMPIAITPDTVQRERFGGIVGQVTAVSPLPVTVEGTVAIIGNSEIVKSLIGETGAAIQITTNLQTDDRNPSGYKWSSSKGPNSKITPGTTAVIRVTVEERSPITFLLPFLREIAGMN